MTKTIDDHWTDWESYVFGMGYGWGEQYTIPALKTWFAAVGREDSPHGYAHETLEAACGPAVAWFIITALVRANIIEYGTSPLHGWLSERGRSLKAYIDSKTADELIALTSRDQDYIECYPDACNCGPRGYEHGRKCGNPFWIERTA